MLGDIHDTSLTMALFLHYQCFRGGGGGKERRKERWSEGISLGQNGICVYFSQPRLSKPTGHL